MCSANDVISTEYGGVRYTGGQLAFSCCKGTRGNMRARSNATNIRAHPPSDAVTNNSVRGDSQMERSEDDDDDE